MARSNKWLRNLSVEDRRKVGAITAAARTTRDKYGEFGWYIRHSPTTGTATSVELYRKGPGGEIFDYHKIR